MQRLVLALCLMAFLGCVLACGGGTHSGSSSSATGDEKGKLIGEIRKLDGRGKKDQRYPKDLPILFADKATGVEYLNASVGREYDELKRIEDSGKAIVVGGNPTVRILDGDRFDLFVEVLDGPHKGNTGWVGVTWILPNGQPPYEDPFKQEREDKFGPGITVAKIRLEEAKAALARMPNDQDYKRALERAQALFEALEQQAHDWRPPKR
jgi:hypothetical protein